mgnify:CR=1 FL=1
MRKMNMKTLIEELISLKQEGAYWDFKREWYSDNKIDDLLHDIICMANNLENHDAYIIIGVDEKDYSIRNVEEDPYRKNTQKIVDFLRDKKFAGGLRPVVVVNEVKMLGGTIDIIEIKNSFNTPFFLLEHYKGVMPNNIYTRVMDTNTPKNRSADIEHIEYLWKKRFRLLATPLERIKYYLHNRLEWSDSPTDWVTVKKYNMLFPEFTIEYTLDDEGNAYQYYLFAQTDTTPHWRKIRLCYHQTVLKEIEGVSLDGGRYFTPVPLTGGISFVEGKCEWDIAYKYFVKDSLIYIVHQFYYEENNSEEIFSHDAFERCILIFSDEQEHQEFREYVQKNWEQNNYFSKHVNVPYMGNLKGFDMNVFKQQYINMQILRKMLEAFRIL